MFRISPYFLRQGAILVMVVAGAVAHGQTYTSVDIYSTDNLSGAGNPTNTTPNPGGGSGGTTAASYALNAGTSRVLNFSSVTGDISLSFPHVRTLPDGIQADNTAPFGITMNVAAYDGLSGIKLDKGSGFLAGVFLDASYPSLPPASLTFTNALASGSGINIGFTDLSPVIGQIFFIGDGLTGNGSGSIQNFHVPNVATRLFLGITDSGGYVGAPGQFQDNDGKFTATFSVVPEPATLGVLVATGLSMLRRRKSA